MTIVGPIYSRHSLHTKRFTYSTVECKCIMCILCSVHLFDRGLVEVEIGWGYVDVNKLLKTNKWIWLDSIKYLCKMQIMQNIKVYVVMSSHYVFHEVPWSFCFRWPDYSVVRLWKSATRFVFHPCKGCIPCHPWSNWLEGVIVVSAWHPLNVEA